MTSDSNGQPARFLSLKAAERNGQTVWIPPLPAGWSLGEAFKALPPHVGTNDLPADILSTLRFDNAELVRSAAPGGADTYEFTATLDTGTGPLADALKDWLPNGRKSSVTVNGTVTIRPDRFPLIELTTSHLAESIALAWPEGSWKGLTALSATLANLSLTLRTRGTGDYSRSAVGIAADLTLGGLSFRIEGDLDGKGLAVGGAPKDQPLERVTAFFKALAGADGFGGDSKIMDALAKIGMERLDLVLAADSKGWRIHKIMPAFVFKDGWNIATIQQVTLSVRNPRLDLCSWPMMGAAGVGGRLGGTLGVNGVDFDLGFTLPGRRIDAALKADTPDSLQTLVTKLTGDNTIRLPQTVGDLKLSRLEFWAELGDSKAMGFEASVLSDPPLPLSLPSLTFKSGSLDFRREGGSYTLRMGVGFELAGAPLRLSLALGSNREPPTLRGRLESRTSSPLTLGELAKELCELQLADAFAAIELSRLEFKAGLEKDAPCSFSGELAWRMQLSSKGACPPLAAQASLELRREKGIYSGTVTGTLAYAGLTLKLAYVFDEKNQSKQFTLFLSVTDDLRLSCEVVSAVKTTLTLTASDVSVGKLIAGMARAIGGSAPPVDGGNALWSALDKLKLAGISFTIDLTSGIGRLEAAIVDTDAGKGNTGTVADVTTIVIKSLSLTYSRVGGKPRLDVQVEGVFFGLELSSAKGSAPRWDALSGPAPQVPKPEVLDLHYLAVGQHIKLPTAASDGVIKTIADLRNQMRPLDDPSPRVGSGSLSFDRTNGFLLATDLTIKGAVKLAAVFRDPTYYGVNVELTGKAAGAFAGLGFEMVYRQREPGLGVFNATFLVPQRFRDFSLGGVEVGIGQITVDLYTNSDFRIDLGFPTRGDFTRSFMVRTPTLAGRGGLYLSRLTGSVATEALRAEKGRFDPVLLAGLGLQVGTRRGFSWGPLSGEVAVSLSVVLEGAIAGWVDENGNPTSERYFKLTGAASIAGEIWGEVNFKVIKVRITAKAQASLLMILESCEPTAVSVRVQVDTSADVRIGFFNVSKSFKLDHTVDATFGAHSDAKWGRVNGVVRPPVPRKEEPRRLDGVPKVPQRSPSHEITAFACPVASRSDRGPVIILTMTMLTGAADGFPVLVKGLLDAAADLFLAPTSSPRGFLRKDFTDILAVADERTLPPDLAVETFRKTFKLSIRQMAETSSAVDAVMIAVPPSVVWWAGSQPEAVRWTHSLLHAAVLKMFGGSITEAWVEAADTRYGDAHKGGPDKGSGTAKVAESLATLVFRDYLLTVIRTAAEVALRIFANDQQNLSLSDVMTGIGKDIPYIGAVASTILMGGSRLPPLSGTGPLQPYTQLTGQQFDILPLSVSLPQICWGLSDPGATLIDRTGSGVPRLFGTLRLDGSTLPGTDLGLQPTIAAIPPITWRPASYALSQCQPWNPGADPGIAGWAAGDQLVLRDFPRDLLHVLPRIDRKTLTLATPDGKPVASGAFVSLIPFGVRRTGSPDTLSLTGNYGPNRDRLLALWRDLADPEAPETDLHLLYVSGSTDRMVLKSDNLDASTTQVLQTGLSTITVAGTLPAASEIASDLRAEDDAGSHDFAAALERPAEFVRMLWQAGVVGAGFLLQWMTEERKGWPAELFATGPDATLWLLAVPRAAEARTVVRDYHNALLRRESDGGEPPLLATPTGGHVPGRTLPTLPPGHAGFILRRPAPAAAHSPALRLVQSMFCLAGFTIDSVAGWEAMPVVPADEGGQWIYAQSTDLARHAPGSLKDEDGLPPSAADPYRGIATRHKTIFRAFFYDGFGNKWPGDSIPLPVSPLYTDELIGPANWPATRLGYSFETKNGCCAVRLEIAMDAEGIVDDDAVKAAHKDFAACYYQLAQPGIDAALRTTLTPESPVRIDPLLAFVKQACRYLAARTAGRAGGPPPEPVIWVEQIIPSAAKAVLPLEVELILRRPKKEVSPDAPGAGMTINRVPPALANIAVDRTQGARGAEADKKAAAALETFTATIEGLLPGYKLALGRITDGRRRLFLVNAAAMGMTAAHRSESAPSLFALPPLAAPLGGVCAVVRPLDDGSGLLRGTPWVTVAEQTRLAGAFATLLSLIERVCSTDYASAAHARNSAAYQRLLTVKRRLANALAERLTDVRTTPCEKSDLKAARERFRQELYTDLTRANTLVGVLQVPVEMQTIYEQHSGKERLRVPAGNGELKVPTGGKVGFGELEAAWGVKTQVIAEMLADVPGLLLPEACITHARTRLTVTVGKGATLRDLLLRLGAPVGGRLGWFDLETPQGLFVPGSPVPLARVTFDIGRSDTLKLLAERAKMPLRMLVSNLAGREGLLKPASFTVGARSVKVPGEFERASLMNWARKNGWSSPLRLAEAIGETAGLLQPAARVSAIRPYVCTLSELAASLDLKPDKVFELLADTPGLLLNGGVAMVNGAAVVLTRQMTLRQLVARLPEANWANLTDEATPFGLFAPGIGLPLVKVGDKVVAVPVPPRLAGRITADGKDAAVQLGGTKLSLANGVNTLDIPVGARALPGEMVSLRFTPEQIEHDIVPIDGTGGYESSHWLHLMKPEGWEVGRSLPALPPLPHIAEPVLLAALRQEAVIDQAALTWTYTAEFSLTPSTSHTYTLHVDTYTTQPSQTDPGLEALVQFDVVACQLGSILQTLSAPPEESTRLHDALETFATLAEKVASHWSAPPAEAVALSRPFCFVRARRGLTLAEPVAGTRLQWAPMDGTAWHDLGPGTSIPQGILRLRFTIAGLDVIGQTYARAALSATETPPVLDGQPLPKTFAVQYGPATFPVPATGATKIAGRAGPDGADLAGSIDALLKRTLKRFIDPAKGCTVDITVDYLLATGAKKNLTVPVTIASRQRLPYAPGLASDVATAAAAWRSGGLPPLSRDTVRLSLAIYPPNARAADPPAVLLTDVRPNFNA